MHGWIILDKPLGLGSTQGVGAVKRALREGGYAKAKVGHGGTLDPLATGVLPIAIGEATKLSGRMLDADKAYDFTIRFGAETDTLDLEGAVIATSATRPARAAIGAVLARFTGPIAQVPPAYSAIRIDGERAYDRARAGEAFEVPVRQVTVHALEAASPLREGRARGSTLASDGSGSSSSCPLPAGDAVLDEITLSARVSKGTYIRSLARDIARALGTVGHVTMLRRTKAGPFGLHQAISLDKLRSAAMAHALEHLILPMTAGLDDIPALLVDPEQAGALRQGRTLSGIIARTGLHLAIDRTVPVALVEVADGDVRVVRGFNLMSKDDA